MIEKFLWMALFFAFSSSLFAVEKVVYGTDDRIDTFNELDPIKLKMAQASVAFVMQDRLIYKENSVEIQTTPLSSSLRSYAEYSPPVCIDEPYYSQPTAPECSGFLVAKDLVVTAGHCVADSFLVKNFKIVFNYKMQSESIFFNEVEKEDVYNIAEVLEMQYDDELDYALVRLDRDVLNVEPLKVRTSGIVEDDAMFYLIGHPSGLPQKITSGAFLIKNSMPFYFSIDSDSYRGNSGSPVINARTHIVEGILVRGQTDHIYDEKNNCIRSNVCTSTTCIEGKGEDVTRITHVKNLNLYL